MNTFNLSQVDKIDQLIISSQTTESEAEASMEIMNDFNQCMVGVTSFTGTTLWEWHPDDEYIQVINGHVDIEIEHGQKNSMKSLTPGDVLIVPKKTWHRQISDEGVQLLFITSSDGNKNVENIPGGIERKGGLDVSSRSGWSS